MCGTVAQRGTSWFDCSKHSCYIAMTLVQSNCCKHKPFSLKLIKHPSTCTPHFQTELFLAQSHIQHDEGEEEPRWGSPTVALMQQIKADSPGRGGIGMKTFTNRAKDYSGATESRKPNSKALLKARAKINTALEEMLDLERTYVSCLTDIVEVSEYL